VYFSPLTCRVMVLDVEVVALDVVGAMISLLSPV
jgi:hypothetical protein